MKFIDSATIYVKAGDGGSGHISFRREKFVPKGGPDGGNGGNGGNIIVQAVPNLNTLLDFRYNRKYFAQNGQKGAKSNCSGKYGDDMIINVPCGTLIFNSDSGDLVADLVENNSRFIVAKGGKGGRGNTEFATAINRTPRNCDPGIPGEEFNITLELKLLADVGIVGLPNVGKSTLISVISAAKPKIADYHFTTLIPNLGIVKIAENKSYVVADIPGLIEGASLGKGLGFQFLRHVERSKSLVFLIDAMSPDPKKDYMTLLKELKKYNPEMSKKKRILCFSKTDAVGEDVKAKLKKIKLAQKDIPIFLISAVSGEKIEELKIEMWNKLQTEIIS
ncbi:MAG: GTPase ObgE [Candidatus Kapabacteria bacterium]|nr:GTPase ObgE [Candidatus Kapabacteria bacterium]